MQDINDILEPKQIEAAEYYWEGHTLEGTAGKYGVTMQELRGWVIAWQKYKDEQWARHMRQLQRIRAQKEARTKKCAHCKWRMSGNDICVLPACFNARKGCGDDGLQTAGNGGSEDTSAKG